MDFMLKTEGFITNLWVVRVVQHHVWLHAIIINEKSIILMQNSSSLMQTWLHVPPLGADHADLTGRSEHPVFPWLRSVHSAGATVAHL